MNDKIKYDESSIQSLEWQDHIRARPGMYIGKLGNGAEPDDGIYVLIKEIIDNCIDEFTMGYGKVLDIKVDNESVEIRDFGRGIPLGKTVDCVSKINTGGKYDNKAFKKSVGLNGVGSKAVNALSSLFIVKSIRDGKQKLAEFSRGILIKDHDIEKTDLDNGTEITFTPDKEIFTNFTFILDHIKPLLWNYAYLNAGLKIDFNGKRISSKNGLLDLLNQKASNEKIRYPIIRLLEEDIEIAMTHSDNYSEEYYAFVNGQNTVLGGTHLAASKESIVKTIRDFYSKDFEPADIRGSIIFCISLRVQNPIFESQTKTKLGSMDMGPDGPTIRTFINDFVKNELNNFLHKNPETAELLLNRILQTQKERKELTSIRKIAKKKSKAANLHNKKLRDCKFHYNDKKTSDENKENTTIFITEGDSASGSITKSRDVTTQAVFSLRGKPLNSFGLSKKIVYENEEFNLLQAALNIENSMEDLRYNNIVIATDADVDGMHIRLLIITFFLQFFPELIKNGHLYILQTPIFRVRNKDKTNYCYSEAEKNEILNSSKSKFEITRFKGLGEISPNEFKNFIGDDIKLDPVIIDKSTTIEELLKFYMGKNTPDRQQFIIDNLKVELDIINENTND